MATTFPALRGHMGDHDYYVVVSTVGEATRAIQYIEEVDDWTSETPPELKLQRKLNIQRVEREMVPYLIHSQDHFYAALTVEVRPSPDVGVDHPVINFSAREEFPGGAAFGVITLDGTETLCALDGQHRLKSLALAIRQEPRLAREQIALILIPFRGIKRSQSLFSDLNRYARPPSKSISLLFTHREGLARVTKSVAALAPVLRGRVNMETTTLSKNAKQFITLSTLYEMTKAWVGDRDLSQAEEDEFVESLVDLWSLLGEAIEEWRLVAADEEHPAYLRARFLHMHGVGQQAIGLAVARARTSLGEEWRVLVGENLKSIDWRLSNPAFQGIVLHAGRVNNTSTNIRNLACLIGCYLGVRPEPSEAIVVAATLRQHAAPIPRELEGYLLAGQAQ